MQPMLSRQRATPQVQPAIAELLRTCVRPPKLSLCVEHVSRSKQKRESDSDSDNPSGRTTKLFLTDGQLVIQALLHRKLSNLPGIDDLRKGDVVEIHDFAIRKARRSNGKGHVVYLGVENCYVIRTENRVQDEEYNTTIRAQIESTGTKRSMSLVEREDTIQVFDDMAGGFFKETEEIGSAHTVLTEGGKINNSHDSRVPSVLHSPVEQEQQAIVRKSAEQTEPNRVIRDTHQKSQEVSSPRHPSAKRKPTSSLTDSDDEEAFETLPIDLGTVNKRRRILHELSQNILSSPMRPPTRESISDVKIMADEHESPVRTSVVRFDLDEHTKQSGSDSDPIISPQPRKVGQPFEGSRDQNRNALIPNIPVNTSKSSTVLPNLLTLPNSASSRPTTPTQGDSAYDWGKFHTLLSLYSPSLPSKSYVFSTLIIPTYVASHLIYRPNSAFPPKRHIKVIDPTFASKHNISKSNVMGKGITVSVYRDAQHFKPAVGRVALMRGVVMQRLNSAIKNASARASGSGTGNCEVILNVYPAKSRIQRQSQSQRTGPHITQSMSRPNDSPSIQHQEASDLTQTNLNVPQNRGSVNKQDKTDVEILSRHQTQQQSESTLIESWFIDDHNFLRNQGYQVDAVQSWWDRTIGQLAN